jgi:Ni,Fe-hydrogenase I large subunit
MKSLSPEIFNLLQEVTNEATVDLAVRKLLKEYLDLKIEELSHRIVAYSQKHQMTFQQFEAYMQKKIPHPQSTQKDYVDWDAAMTQFGILRAARGKLEGIL